MPIDTLPTLEPPATSPDTPRRGAPVAPPFQPPAAPPTISARLGGEIQQLADGPRVLGRMKGERPGPTLLIVGSLHGNEPAGALGLAHLFRRLDAKGLRGQVIGMVGNRQALARGCRFVDADLNRSWTMEQLQRVRAADLEVLRDEDLEMRELDTELRHLLANAPRPIYFLDLHTTSAPGPAFVNLDDTLPNRRFALELPLPVVVGLEEELEGTLASYLSFRGVITVGFESGQHQEFDAVDRAEAAAWIALEATGVLPRGARPEVEQARRMLEAHRGDLPRIVEVIHRHPVAPDDGFRMRPGFVGFQSIEKDQALADDRGGSIHAPQGGRILMPLYQSQGADGFFVIQPIRMLWLKISATVRRLHLERVIHWLPGVERHKEETTRFRIDRRVARWYALELFHLLGFRREQITEHELMMSRRTRNGI